MSAGPFTISKYSANSARIYNITVQPETLSATIATIANAAPAGATTEEVSAQVSKGRRSVGMNARTVSLIFTGAPPTGYKGTTVRVPVLTAATFNAWTATPNLAGTYLGAAVRVSGSKPEFKR